MTTQQPPPGGQQNPDESTSSDLPSYGDAQENPPAGGYPPPPPPPGPGAPGGYGMPQENNKKALWSMILGIVSLLCCGLVTGVIAIVLAQLARTEIKQTGQGGGGMATAGFWLGIVGTAWSVLYAILVLTGVIDFTFETDTSGW